MSFSSRLPLAVRNIRAAENPETGEEILLLEEELDYEISKPLKDAKRIKWLTDQIRELVMNGKKTTMKF